MKNWDAREEENDAALEFICPRCSAVPLEPCVNLLSGKNGKALRHCIWVHRERLSEYWKARNAEVDAAYSHSLQIPCARCGNDVGVKCSNLFERSRGREVACRPHLERLQDTRPEPQDTRPAPFPFPLLDTCAFCAKDLAGENQDFVKLGWIKYRLALCNDEYLGLKSLQVPAP